MVALPGLPLSESPGMSGPVRFTVITLRVDITDRHHFTEGGREGVSAGVSQSYSFPPDGQGKEDSGNLDGKSGEHRCKADRLLTAHTSGERFKIKIKGLNALQMKRL